MIKILLPVVLVIALLFGFGYWKFIGQGSAGNLEQPILGGITPSKTTNPGALETRVTALENSLATLIGQFNDFKNSNPANNNTSSQPVIVNGESRLKAVETAIADLKTRVADLEKKTSSQTTSTTTTKSVVYIPLGSGGNAGNTDWYSLSNYQITLNPSDYPGYTNMQLEVNFRLTSSGGTAYARLYNSSDGTGLQQVTTTSTSLNTQTSYYFNLARGSKTYTLQVKSDQGSNLEVQSARIKVNF